MKAPLLEYLDKLEATAKGDTWACEHPAACREHYEAATTLALIAKLREAVQLAKDLSVDIWEHPTTGEIVKAALQRKIDALQEIEVPE